VEAQVKVCPDTLDDYNYERFVQDTMLYYTLLPEDCYTLENEGKVTIKKGDEYALLSVQFDLSTTGYVQGLCIAFGGFFRVGL